jgi:hypothetical protein
VAEISHIRFVKQKRETGIDRNRGFMWDLFGNVGCVDSGGATMIAALMSRARAFAVLLAIGVSVTPARAVDGTWTGGALPIVNEWTQGTNWNSTPSPNTVPDNTATFTSVATTSVIISASTSINTIQFTAAGAGFHIYYCPRCKLHHQWYRHRQ